MITLILGDSDLPIKIISKLKRIKKKFVIIDLSKKNKFKNIKNSYRVKIGKFGQMIK